jgi:predicted RNA-binding protein YlxR (DUF448 family)
MVCNLPRTPQKELWRLWANGTLNIGTNKNLQEQAKYITKNMSKLENSWKLFGHKGYFHSRGLQRNIVARTWKVEEADIFHEVSDSLDNAKVQFRYQTVNEYAGTFTYSSYKIKSKRFKILQPATKKKYNDY